MNVSVQSKALWVENDVQNVAFSPQVNLVSGDGVSIYLPLALLAASCDFMKSLLQYSCTTCGGVTRVSLPSVSGDTLTLASQILLSGESEHMDADKIVNNLENVLKLLELLGCKAQLRTVCSRSLADLQSDCMKSLADMDDGVRVMSQEKIVTEVELHNRRGQELFTEIKDVNQNYENLLLDTRFMKKGENRDVVYPGPHSNVADPIRDETRTEFGKGQIKTDNKAGGRGSRSHGSKAAETTKRLSTSSSSSCAGPRLRSSGFSLRSQKRKTRQTKLEETRTETVKANTVKQKRDVKRKKTATVLSNSSEYIPCPDCDETFRYMVSLRKHQVDEHFYEELEVMFVEEFLECSVCCKIDFSNTGLGMFIRHKAENHKAVEIVQKMAETL